MDPDAFSWLVLPICFSFAKAVNWTQLWTKQLDWECLERWVSGFTAKADLLVNPSSDHDMFSKCSYDKSKAYKSCIQVKSFHANINAYQRGKFSE